MASQKFYVAMYVVLFAFASLQVGVEMIGFLDSNYTLGFVVILALSWVKAAGVAAWYMHLTDEPRSITYLAGSAVVIVMLLAVAASYSIL